MKTMDDELIRRLRAELDELTADISVPPALASIDPAQLVTVVGAPPLHPRRRVAVLVAALVAVIVGVAGLVAVRGRDEAVGSEATAAQSVPVVSTAAAPEIIHPVPPTPAGWDLLDWGNVRLAVPPELSPFRPDNGCVATPSDPDLEIVRPIAADRHRQSRCAGRSNAQ
jgi:hypothetical protein